MSGASKKTGLNLLVVGRSGAFSPLAELPPGPILGEVHILVLSGPQLAGLVHPDEHVDLVAARRGDLAALQQLEDVSGLLHGWIARPDVESQVLSWTQVES